MTTVELPTPGLDGTYRDSCVVCLQGTDTALALTGEAEWVIASLVALGIPSDQATVLVSSVTGCDPGKVPIGDFTLVFRVCAGCAATVGAHVGMVIPDGPLPNYTQQERVTS